MFQGANAQIAIDTVQTAVLAVVAWALIYVMLLLRNEMRAAAGSLNRVLTNQAETTATLDRLWKRIELVEIKIGAHSSDGSV